MRHLTLFLALAMALGALPACSGKAAQDAYHDSFRKSFKESFMKSCEGQGATETLCGCIDDKLETKFNDDQLTKLAMDPDATKQAIGDATKACTASH